MSSNVAAWTLITFVGLALFTLALIVVGMIAKDRTPRGDRPRMTVTEFVKGIRF